METVDLQAKKMGAQDSASSTEESLGVNKVVSSPDSKPHKQQKGKKGLADATSVVKRDILARIKFSQLTKVYARRNPAMIQQLETTQVVERKGFKKQNTWKRVSRRTQKKMKFWAFYTEGFWKKWTHHDLCVTQ